MTRDEALREATALCNMWWLRGNLAGEIADALLAAAQEARASERERAAVLMESFNANILQLIERPGGPSRSYWRPTTNADRAAAIRASKEGT